MPSQEKSLYLNLSPLDHRYYMANRELFDELSRYLSEQGNIWYLLRVEEALLLTHLEEAGVLDPDLEQAVRKAAEEVTPDEVYEEEAQTQHNIRALVNVYVRHLPEKVRPYVHLGATSVDIMDTAAALRYRDAMRRVVLPLLLQVERILIELAEREAETPQVGRTHGQYAVPITFGYAVAEYVSRLGKSILRLEDLSRDLRGKLSGAVGAYNATSLLVRDPRAFERRVLSRLGLLPTDHATQLVEPEYLLRLLLELNVAFGILANLADDLRHLQRSEIGEVQEAFGEKQVGSSTMPHKRNPWNSEHVKSLWKAFAPRVLTFYMDQISEHQRDLTNSASARFVTEYVAGFVAAAERMRRILSGLKVHRDRMLQHLKEGGGAMLAEAAYVLLARAGEWNGHEIVRRATLEAERTGKSFLEVLAEDRTVWEKLSSSLAETVGEEPETFFAEPWRYRGKAPERARELAREFSRLMDEIEERL
ncbi:lyase family protein [Spirochaeta thermophila]|uniref:Putative adenylosuccinate lyase n=1 Tax=Winmispira thermophila (strain ATCC 49972 / DSM 6192 / RI 19.B1) TaxID=665571 RepID=E0RSF9_WINT6|nr:lyase family protein [Spirochaeta thermophila]ADN01946.1 putative adenylosuccinate lyase [Spirochaeta thermophila DSM 6192]